LALQCSFPRPSLCSWRAGPDFALTPADPAPDVPFARYNTRMDVRRALLGVFAVLLLAAWVGVFVYSLTHPVGSVWLAAAASCMKAGLALAAVWLAYPKLQGGPRWYYGLIAVGIGLVLIFRQAIIIVVPTLFVVWLFSARLHGRGKKSSAGAKR
jgi:4-amino-4-deoxy-L-arabinose transferase-like glycosyltransferase